MILVDDGCINKKVKGTKKFVIKRNQFRGLQKVSRE